MASAYNKRAQNAKMKKYIIIAGVAAVAYYCVFVSAKGKELDNKVALKLGIGTAEKPLIK